MREPPETSGAEVPGPGRLILAVNWTAASSLINTSQWIIILNEKLTVSETSNNKTILGTERMFGMKHMRLLLLSLFAARMAKHLPVGSFDFQLTQVLKLLTKSNKHLALAVSAFYLSLYQAFKHRQQIKHQFRQLGESIEILKTGLLDNASLHTKDRVSKEIGAEDRSWESEKLQ